MVSIKDIAKKLNLGVSTVSMALNNNPRISIDTRKIVRETAKEMNYVKNGVAVDLQRKKTNTILLVLEDASRPYFSKFLEEFQKYISEYEYDLLIATTYKGNKKTALRYISENRVDGAVVFTKSISDDFLKRYASPSFPIVAISRKIQGENLYSIYFEGNLGSKLLTQYLIENGHRKIAFMKASNSTIGSSTRYEGFKEVLRENGILDKHILINAGYSTFKAGYDATQKLIKENSNIDAIFYANDDIAFGGMEALKQAGILIPDDISIVGSNNLPLSKYVSPALTTTSGGQGKMAFQAVNQLMRALGKEIVQNELFEDEPNIIIRESVKRKK